MSINSISFILLNVVLTILLLPFFIGSILIITVILFCMDMASPVFFKQLRIGRLGKPFYVIKFRTLKNNVYLHKFAKFLRLSGLDETPQLVNIFKGEMLLFGPRPKLYDEIPPDIRKDYNEIVLKRYPGLFSLYISEKGPGQSILLEQNIPLLIEYEKYEQAKFSTKLIFKIFYRCIKKCIKGTGYFMRKELFRSSKTP